MKYAYLLVSIILCSLFGCKGGGAGTDRGHFSWTGTIEKVDITWYISCDSTCDNCTAKGTYHHDSIIENLSYTLAKSTYGPIYDYCNNSTRPYTPPNPPTNDSVVPTGKVSFSAAAGTKFGFDGWIEANAVKKINYLSIAAGCSTFVTVNLSGNLSTAYGKVIAVLPTASADGVSFTNIGTTDTLVLTDSANTDSVNNVPIYAKTNATLKTPIKMNIYGIDDPAKPVCLAGGSLVSEDRLEIVVYNEKIYDKCKLYLVNSPVSTPDTSLWKSGFNTILKQAVLKCTAPTVVRSIDMTWDKNGNGVLDHFVKYTGAPEEKYEFTKLLATIDQYDKCYVNSDQATIVVKYPIRTHWVIANDVLAGATTIFLNTVEGIVVNKDQYVGPWLNIGGDKYEWVRIISKDTTNNSIKICKDAAHPSEGLQYNHSKYETFWNEHEDLGFTIGSCSFVEDNQDIMTYIHEFLHQDNTGSLADLDPAESDNIMFPAQVGRLDTKLKYRDIKTFTQGVQGQWGLLQK